MIWEHAFAVSVFCQCSDQLEIAKKINCFPEKYCAGKKEEVSESVSHKGDSRLS